MKKWVCNVCGYEHEGDSPPEFCPICGAGADEFTLVTEAPAAANVTVKPEASSSTWVCKVCGFEHQGLAPPDVCSVCGAPQEQFVRKERTGLIEVHFAPSVDLLCRVCSNPLDSSRLPSCCPLCGSTDARLFASSTQPIPSSPSRRYVIVGGGIAGLSAVEQIRSQDSSAQITLISREKVLPYYRLNLTRYIHGDLSPAQLPIHPMSFYSERRISLMLGVEALSISRDQHLVMTTQGPVPYDRLVMASGSRAFVPPLKNMPLCGVTTLRSLRDATFVKESSRKGSHVVVVGGGVLGLEAAYSLARLGAHVTVCEGSSFLLSRQLDEASSRIVQSHVEESGIKFIFGDLPTELVGDESVRAVKLASGRILDASLVILSAGIRPNTIVEKESGLEVARGVVVDDTMKTSDADIYAAGDGAEHHGNVYGIWPASMEMGRLAGLNACGVATLFAAFSPSNLVKVLDIDVYSVGNIGSSADGLRIESSQPSVGRSYEKLVFSGNHLLGAILVGDASKGASLKKLIENKTDLSELLSKKQSSSELIASVKNLPR